MLDSSYGSTNPSCRNPATGKPYGPDFPALSVEDIVAAQRE
jgi:homoserine O-acetyltransferase